MADTLTQLKYESDIEYVFTDTFDVNGFKCIEIEPEMLEDLESGKLEIRGDLNDETVLVSASKSYKIRQHDSSNTILLTSLQNKDKIINGNDKQHDNELLMQRQTESIFTAITCIFTLEQQPPRLNKLYQILYQRPYKGVPTPEITPDGDGNDDDHKANTSRANKIDLSFEGLKLLVQCSDQELMNGLQEINAIQIKNEWRIIDETYLNSCFQDILYCLMENSLDHKKFKASDIVANTHEFPAEIILHCLKIYATSREDEYCSLDETKVCIFCAKQVLMQNGNAMRQSQFEQEWRDTLPYGMPADLAMLKGHLIGIYDKRMAENMWSIFQEKELSLAPKQRFKTLFDKKEEWSEQEIEPYLATLIKSGSYTVDKLLLKHARMIRKKDEQGNEIRSYISRTVKRQ